MNSSIQLLRNNFLYILWFFVYFSIAWAMLGADGRSLFFCLLFYAVAMLVALSPIGEWFIRLTNHARRLETNREIDSLVPIFEEVYDEAKEQYPYLPKIKIFTGRAEGRDCPRNRAYPLWSHNGFAFKHSRQRRFLHIRDCGKVCHHNFRPVANTV